MSTTLEKIEILLTSHFDEWIKTRDSVEDELSQMQPMFCVCRHLASGFHERFCKRFQKKVSNETLKRLKHLLKTP